MTTKSIINQMMFGALKGFNLEPSLLDELTDWEAQLKPFREEILDITGGGA